MVTLMANEFARRGRKAGKSANSFARGEDPAELPLEREARGKVLRMLLVLHGGSREAFAAAVGKKPATLFLAKESGNAPPLDTLVQINGALGYPPSLVPRLLQSARSALRARPEAPADDLEGQLDDLALEAGQAAETIVRQVFPALFESLIERLGPSSEAGGEDSLIPRIDG